MDGRRARFIVGMFCAIGSVVTFLLGSFRGTEITWQSVAGHVVFLLVSLLLMDHKLGMEVLRNVLRKVPRGGRDAS